MGRESICYHTRLQAKHTRKVSGGTFEFTSPEKYFDPETIERLVNSDFEVGFTRTGLAFFIDKEGREVDLYISVDPLFTTRGQEAHKVYLAEKRKRDEEAEELHEEQEGEIEDLLDGMPHEEAVRRLKEGK